jgi:TRAP-type C4-dicarboxylate transport system substrate-binding protein
MKNRIVLLVLILALLVPSMAVFAEGQKEAASQTIEARMPSAESDGDFMTVWANNFADYMREETDGDFDIQVFPYGTLGENRDIVELAQMGVVEFVFADYGWLSGFVPEVNILALHYVWPRENLPEVLEWVVQNGDFFPALQDKFRANDLMPLGIYFEGWQWLTSKYPINSLDDLRGLKTRVMGSEMLTRDYRAYGIDPTPLAYGEIYSALQTGLLDAQSQPMFANYSMGFYEVADFFVQLWAEPFLGIPTINAAFYDSLSPEYQDLITGYWKGIVAEASNWGADLNAERRAAIEETRPQVKFSEMNADQVAQLKKMAQEKVYPNFHEVAGDDAPDMLEVLLQDIEDAKAAIGM